MIAAIAALAPDSGMTKSACARGLSPASVQGRLEYQARPPAAPRPRKPPPRALTAAQTSSVLAVLHELRFAGQAPAEIYATLLDEGHLRHAGLNASVAMFKKASIPTNSSSCFQKCEHLVQHHVRLHEKGFARQTSSRVLPIIFGLTTLDIGALTSAGQRT